MKLPTKESVKESKIYKKLMNFAKSNGFAVFIASSIIWIIALIPTWIYFLIRWGVGPEDFWQELAILVLCGIIMGWIQIFLALIAFYLTLSFIMNEPL